MDRDWHFTMLLHGGVSLTHGPPGNRSHLWIFAATQVDGHSRFTPQNCPCSNTDLTWRHTIPDFVGQEYFCDSNSEYEDGYVRRDDESDPLWDGEGCGPTSSCCEFNQPPYFCKHLSYITSEDMEVRVLSYTSIHTAVSLIEIFIKFYNITLCI